MLCGSCVVRCRVVYLLFGWFDVVFLCFWFAFSFRYVLICLFVWLCARVSACVVCCFVGLVYCGVCFSRCSVRLLSLLYRVLAPCCYAIVVL